MSWLLDFLCSLNLALTPLPDYCAQNHYQKPPPVVQPAKKSLDVLLNSDVSQTAVFLEGYGYNLSPEDLIYFSRVVYFESGNNGRNLAELRRGLEAVVHTIVNRWKFDNSDYSLADGTKTGYRRFGDGSLMSIIQGKNTPEFSVIKPNQRFLTYSNFREESGKYKLSYTSHPIITDRITESYRAVLGVLIGDIEDPTTGALYFKNPWVTGKRGPHQGIHIGSVVRKSSSEKSYSSYYLLPPTIIGAHHFYAIEKKEKVIKLIPTF